MVSRRRKAAFARKAARKAPERWGVRVQPKKRGRFYRIAERLDTLVETHPVARLCGLCFAVVGGLVLVATGWQVYFDYQFRQEDRIARAWQVVTAPVGGNTGKGAAISFLLQNGADLTGLNLSCERVGGNFAAGTQACVGGVIISDLQYGSGMISDWNLRGVIFTKADLRRKYIRYPQLYGARIEKSDFSSGRITGCIDHVTIEDTNLSGAWLQIDCDPEGQRYGLQIINSDVSRLRVDLRRGLSWHLPVLGLRESYAWADRPPVHIQHDKEYALPVIKYCDPTEFDGPMRPSAYEVDKRFILFYECNVSESEARRRWPGRWKDIEPAIIPRVY